ncbi:hypothetical protein [Streptomyces sp. NPDC056796]|uniref:hypothetical protein n=1 Tax=Streptomyces sp. NPDC056796 TaxID=3345947 RepID=UPI0036B57FDE
MDDLLLTLAVPAVVIASGVYAVRDCRRQRRRPPPPYTRRAARLASRDVLLTAEAVVEGAYAALGTLYDGPAGSHPAGHVSTVGAGPDQGPSQPAPARRP